MLPTSRLLFSLLLLFCTLFSQAHMIQHWQHSHIRGQAVALVASPQHIAPVGQPKDSGDNYPQWIDSPCPVGFAAHHYSGGACHCLLSLYNVQQGCEHRFVLDIRECLFPTLDESLSQYDPHSLNPPPRRFC